MSSTEEPARDFGKVVSEFLCDLFTSFPELQENADERIVAFLGAFEAPKEYDDCDSPRATDDSAVQIMKDYCSARFPERFFDILYKNEEMFELKSTGDTTEPATNTTDTTDTTD